MQSAYWVPGSFYKDAFYGFQNLLYSMSISGGFHTTEFALVTTIEAMQLMSFALPLPSMFGFQYSNTVTRLSNTFASVHFGEKLVAAVGTVPAILVIIFFCALVVFNLFNMSLAWERKEKSELTKVQMTMNILRFIIVLVVFIFQVPFLTVISRVFNCSGISTNTECTVMYPIALVMVCALTIFGLIILASVVDPRPKSRNPAARSHSRIHIYHFLVKSTLAVMYPFFLDATPADAKLMQFLWVSVTMVLSVPLAFMYTWYHPYFNRWSTIWVSLLYNVQAWFSIATLIHVIVMEFTTPSLSAVETTSVLVFGGSGLAMLFSWLMVNYRWYKLSIKPITSCRNVFEFELRVRAELQSTNPYAGEITERLSRVHLWFLEMSKQFPGSGLLHLFHGYVIFEYHPEKLALVRRSLFMAHHIGISMDLKFILYKLRELIRDSKSSSSVMKIIRFDLLSQDALDYDRQCTLDLIEFWREIAKSSPSMAKVRELTTAVASSSAFCKEKYTELIQLDPLSSMALKKYGSFLSDIVNDSENASRLFQKATNLELNAQNANIEAHIDTMSFDYVGVLLVRGGFDTENPLSTKSHSTGEILKANEEAGNLLNELSSSLVGKRVQGFFGPPFADLFDDAIAEFVKEGNDAPFQGEHETFLKERDGTFSPVLVHLEPYLSLTNELTVFVMFSDVTKAIETDMNFVVFEEDGTILGVSKEFSTTFSSMYEKVQCPYTGHLANISSLVKDFRELKQEIKRARDGQVWVKFDRVREEILLSEEISETSEVRVLVRLKEVRALGKLNYVLLVTIDSNEIIDEVGRRESIVELEDGMELPSISHRNFEFAPSLRNFEGESMRSLNGPGNRPGRALSNAGSMKSDAKLRRKAMEIRKLLLQDSHARMDSILRKLQKIYFRAMVVLLLISIGQFIFCNGLLTDFQANLDFIGKMGFRRTLSLQIAYAVHTLVLVNQGFLPLSSQDSARDLLRSASTTLMDYDAELFRIRDSVGLELHDLYDTEVISFSFLRKGVIETESLSLYDGVLRISGLAYQVANKSLDNFRYDNQLVFPLLANVAGENLTVQHGLERSTDLYSAYVRDSVDQMLLIFETSSGILCFGTSIALLIAIYPLIGNGGKIENTKREVFSIFHAIPSSVSTEISDRFVNRLFSIHGEKLDNGVFDDDNQKEDQIPVAQTTPDKKSIAKPAPKRKSRTKSRRGEKRRRRKLLSIQKLLIVAKMISILILGFVYFTANIVLISNTNRLVRGAPHVINFAGFRRSESLLVSHEIRLFLSGAFTGINGLLETSSDVDFAFPSSPNMLRRRADGLLETHDLVMHGSESEDITGTLHEIDTGVGSATHNLLKLYTSDGCFDWPSDGIHTEADCHSFLNGILATGLHNAIIQFGSMIYDLSFNDTLSHIASTGSDSERIETFSHGSAETLIHFESEFLQTQLNTVIQLHSNQTRVMIDGERKVMLTLTIGFILLSLCCYVLLVRRVFQSLDQDIKRTRSLLLVIPEDVFQGLGDMHQFLLDQFGSSNQSQVSYGRNGSSKRALVTPL